MGAFAKRYLKCSQLSIVRINGTYSKQKLEQTYKVFLIRHVLINCSPGTEYLIIRYVTNAFDNILYPEKYSDLTSCRTHQKFTLEANIVCLQGIASVSHI